MKKYVFVCLVVAALACVKDPLPPPDALSKDQMIGILIDIHLAEAKVGRLPFRSLDSSKALFRKMEHDIFKKHRTDTATYRKSFNFYLNNTAYLDEIYAAVVDSLSYRKNIGKVE
jgi:cAMP phosphodiesterase